MSSRYWLINAALLIAAFSLAACGKSDSGKPKSIKVVGDRSYAPYEFLEGGASTGLLVDLWKKWAERTGIRVDYELDAWEKSQDKVKRGEAEVIGGIMEDDERHQYFDFVRNIMTIDEFVFFRSTSYPGADFSDFDQLKPYTVGVVKADEAERMYKKKTSDDVKILALDSYADVVKAAVDGRIDIFMMEQPVARYWLDVYDKTRAFQRSKTRLFHQDQYIAVRKGDERLKKLIIDGFDELSSADVYAIRDKWEGYRINIKEDSLADRFVRFVEFSLLCVHTYRLCGAGVAPLVHCFLDRPALSACHEISYCGASNSLISSSVL